MRSIYSILTISILCVCVNSFAQDVYFPDKDFLYLLKQENVDKNNDGKIEVSEALLVDTLEVSTYSIRDLTGIEAFTNLSHLIFSHNKLKSVDLSKNTKIKYIDCSFNDSLTSLNISTCLELEELHCFKTRVGNLDVSRFLNLRILDCPLSRRSELDVSKNIHLTDLGILYNRLTTVDLSNNPKLTYLDISWSLFTSLDVSKNPELKYLDVSGNAELSSICVLDTNYAKTNPKFIKDATQKWTQICDPLSVESEEIIAEQTCLYPNPVHNIVYLSIPYLRESIQVRLMEISGRIVHEQQVYKIESEINTSQLSAGTYYLSFVQNNKVINKKIVLVR